MNKIYYIKYVLFIIFNQNMKILLRHLLVNILMKHFQFRYFSSKLTQITFSKWNFVEISKNNPFWTLIEYYIADFIEKSLFSSKTWKTAREIRDNNEWTSDTQLTFLFEKILFLSKRVIFVRIIIWRLGT